MTSTDDPSLSAVPTWPALVVPVLRVLESGEVMHRKDLFDEAAKIAGLGPAARSETLNSGGFRYEQRFGWALSNLSKASWVDRPSRGYYAINDAGRQSLRDYSEGFDYSLARQVFAPFWPGKSQEGEMNNPSIDDVVAILDPIEQIEDGINLIEQEVGEELLMRLRENHPDFFEQA